MNMLQPESPPPVRSIDNMVNGEPSPESLQVTFQSVLDFIQRQYALIAVAAVSMIALGVLYLFTTSPSFTATATMLIDSKKVQLFQQQSMFTDVPIDASAVESQVEILKSESVALAVIKKLKLAEDPEFVSGGGGLIGALLSVVMAPFTSSAGPSS